MLVVTARIGARIEVGYRVHELALQLVSPNGCLGLQAHPQPIATHLKPISSEHAEVVRIALAVGQDAVQRRRWSVGITVEHPFIVGLDVFQPQTRPEVEALGLGVCGLHVKENNGEQSAAGDGWLDVFDHDSVLERLERVVLDTRGW